MSFFTVTGNKIIITEVCTKGRKELARIICEENKYL